MSKHMNEEFNKPSTSNTPKESKGGTFASADMPLIKDAIYALLKVLDSADPRIRQAANLLHRIGRIS